MCESCADIDERWCKPSRRDTRKRIDAEKSAGLFRRGQARQRRAAGGVLSRDEDRVGKTDQQEREIRQGPIERPVPQRRMRGGDVWPEEGKFCRCHCEESGKSEYRHEDFDSDCVLW